MNVYTAFFLWHFAFCGIAFHRCIAILCKLLLMMLFCTNCHCTDRDCELHHGDSGIVTSSWQLRIMNHFKFCIEMKKRSHLAYVGISSLFAPTLDSPLQSRVV